MRLAIQRDKSSEGDDELSRILRVSGRMWKLHRILSHGDQADKHYRNRSGKHCQQEKESAVFTAQVGFRLDLLEPNGTRLPKLPFRTEGFAKTT